MKKILTSLRRAIMRDAAKALLDVKNLQGTKGNYDVSPYMQGMYNGIELSVAILQGREPNYK